MTVCDGCLNLDNDDNAGLKVVVDELVSRKNIFFLKKNIFLACFYLGNWIPASGGAVPRVRPFDRVRPEQGRLLGRLRHRRRPERGGGLKQAVRERGRVSVKDKRR